jgi:hypothetical protein
VADKITTYWRVRSGDDPDAKPHWDPLDAQPKTTEGLVGELRVENDDQVILVYFADEAARVWVTRNARDAAALVQEWMTPHKPASESRSDC